MRGDPTCCTKVALPLPRGHAHQVVLRDKKRDQKGGGARLLCPYAHPHVPMSATPNAPPANACWQTLSASLNNRPHPSSYVPLQAVHKSLSGAYRGAFSCTQVNQDACGSRICWVEPECYVSKSCDSGTCARGCPQCASTSPLTHSAFTGTLLLRLRGFFPLARTAGGLLATPGRCSLLRAVMHAYASAICLLFFSQT